MEELRGSVVGVARDDAHRFSKPTRDAIRLVEGWGVEGDAHAGPTVKHRFDARRKPGAPNLKQVHLIAAELFEELAVLGYDVAPGDLGENVTTRGLDLLALPRGTVLRLGLEAAVVLTGLRTPCKQIDDALGAGLMRRLMDKHPDGTVTRRAGVMAVVHTAGVVRPDDPIAVELPDGPHDPLPPV